MTCKTLSVIQIASSKLAQTLHTLATFSERLQLSRVLPQKAPAG